MKKSNINWNYVFILIIMVLLILYIFSQVECFIKDDNDPKLYELQALLMPLFDVNKKYDGVLECINGRDLMNEVSLFKGRQSYTLNKEDIYLCLKDRNGEYYSNNILVYVLLHEVAHSLNTVDYGHSKMFYKIFYALLDEAEKLKIYDSRIAMNPYYCK